MILWAILGLFLLWMVTSREGLQEDSLSLAIKSIQSAKQDDRMTPPQKQALDDALDYANYIKNL
jgi:hypothetical protein